MSYDYNGIGTVGYEIEDASYDELIDSGYNPSNDLDYNSTIPETDRGWFLEEEAKAGPIASQQDIQDAYPKGFDNSTSSGVWDILKNIGSSLSQPTTQAGLLKLLTAAMAIKGYLDPKFGKTGYQGKVNMNLKATTPTYAQADRAYGAGAKGQAYFGPTTYAAHGGIMDLARGGQPRYLDGSTDGMADKINTSIDNVQPAKLSHGEFVIPADVVSHLGNGNSSAGAKVLYSMMEKVRKARTGNKKQGKQINPSKFMPGGIAGYVNGGAVAFNGTTTSTVPNPTTTPVGYDSNLAPYVGDYVTSMLSKANAEANKAYVPYTGTLTAGTSPLQTAAFTAASNIKPYTPTTFTNQFSAPAAYTTGQFINEFQAPDAYTTGQFDTGLGPVKSVEGYMNPYMQAVVNVQSTEAQRQAEIARVAAAGRLAQAGGYGGSRQAIMESEGNRNLQTLLGEIQAKGSQSAYASALAQRLAESEASMNAQKAGEASRQFGAGQGMTAAELMARFGLDAKKATEQSRQFGSGQAMTAAQEAARYGLAAQQGNAAENQFGANFGLNALQAQMAAGAAQSAIEQKALDAKKAQFDQQQNDAMTKLLFQKSMLSGLPLESVSPASSGQQDLAALTRILAGG